ncbi:MAG: hypothetical protein U9O94_00475 [Nanoarchaeota archaeon]|nr:hypothetical protein [Nanoarchaeota archaeon]
MFHLKTYVGLLGGKLTVVTIAERRIMFIVIHIITCKEYMEKLLMCEQICEYCGCNTFDDVDVCPNCGIPFNYEIEEYEVEDIP